jgi:cell wall-associated NlpC family hydrolase
MRLPIEGNVLGHFGGARGGGGSFTIGEMQRTGGIAPWAPQEGQRAQRQEDPSIGAEQALAHPEEYLEGLYQRLLGRSVDGEGVAGFGQKMREMNARGASWEEIQQAVEADIVGSPEYAARQQPPSTPGTAGSAPGTSGTPGPSGEPVPGAERAIAYAENPGINPNTGTNDWAYWCLALVNQAYGGGTDGMLRAGTATGAFNNYQQAGRIQQGDNPPRGALVFFDYTGKDGVDYGHVGISLGDGTYIGTTTDGTNTGVRPIQGNLPYKGWAYP